MAGLNLYTSNRMEYLADTLADILSRNPLAPMQQELIAIPSGGLERFVAFRLAERLGVCANTGFPFPNALVHFFFKTVLPDIPERSAFSPEILGWKIMDLLPDFLDKKEFRQLRQYVEDDTSQIKLFQLSSKIADLFDQYTVFRPEMIKTWETGQESKNPDEQWQSVLWRKIHETVTEEHRGLLKRRLIRALQENPAITAVLPPRIALFGVSFLPQFHLDILYALARHIDVNLFTLNPCRHFWDDVISQKSMAIKSVAEIKKGRDISLLHYETGNRLLSSLGSSAKELLGMLHALDSNEQSGFSEPEGSTMLSLLQSDLLNMHTPQTPHIVDDTDRTVQIHTCHSPLREMEVLHDTLLSLFEQDQLLKPDDIVVMIPQIEEYAPYIQTVFDAGTLSMPRLPYTLADMAGRKTGSLIDDFFAVCDLGKNRFSASAVITILESEAVRNRFAITEEDLSLILSWIEGTNIRWGIDGQDKTKNGMLPTVENTWEAGLKRLLLGFAVSPDGDKLFDGILPFGSAEGSDALTAGKFYSFLEHLFDCNRQLGGERNISEWADLLLSMLERLYTPHTEEQYSFQALRLSITGLTQQQERSGFNKKIPFSVIRYFLEASLSIKAYGKGYITGGITFCTMLPMRSVPFKVVCLAGMNDGSFPRTDSSVSFDLIATNPEPGDRSLRKEDRFCFLESLLSARNTLYISYTGLSITDNSAIPPSVLVSELIDYISLSFTIGSLEKQSAAGHITTHHRLNAFSRHYFEVTEKPQKLFSFSRENLEAAKASTVQPVAFIRQPLPLPADDRWKNISIDELCRYFSHPVKHFLRNRLGIRPPEIQSMISDIEPFTIEGLGKYQLSSRLLEKKAAGDSAADTFETIRASGVLPHGAVGSSFFEDISGTIDRFASSLLKTGLPGSSKPFHDGELACAGFLIRGRLQILTKNNLLHFRTARIKVKDRLRIWITHLFLNAVCNAPLPRTSLLVGMDKEGGLETREYRPVENPVAILEGLLSLYTVGQTTPLRFFPETSCAFAEALVQAKPLKQALANAQSLWDGDARFTGGERDDEYYALFPGGSDPFCGDFDSVAQHIFQPLFLHEQRRAV